MSKIKIGIIGATGYTGSELTRILLNHPQAELKFITSESRANEKFYDIHPFFEGLTNLETIPAAEATNYDLDVLFLALPHGVSMKFTEQFYDKKHKIIDLSGDFRLSGPAVYEEWYGKKHSFIKGFEKSVYGLPEWYKNDIKTAQLVANPGCFPTNTILAIAPLLKSKIAQENNIITDAKTGVTGAGVKPKEVNMFGNVNDNFKAYGLKNHRHSIEMREQLGHIAQTTSSLLFTPHLLPVDRGILSTSYLKPKKELNDKELKTLYKETYKDAPFVRIRSQAPAIKDVRGTNYCDIYATFDPRTKTYIVISAIDNLMKGAAGQAVQNMNIMFDTDEKQGLESVPLHP